MTHNPEMTRGYGRQFLDDADREQVLQVLDSAFLTQGPKVSEFEEALCRATGAAHAVAVSSGTAAVHLACLALDIGPGKKVATQDISFIASANAALYCGASLTLVDVDPRSMSMTPDTVRRAGVRPDLIIPVHFAGLSVLDGTFQSEGFAVIEDACHALGAVDSDGSAVGSCAHSDMCAFSFHPVKSITTAEGGAITTNSDRLAEALRELRNHGLVRDPSRWRNRELGLDGIDPNPWYYEQQSLGFNYRMTELQAALGISQMAKLSSFIAKRRSLALAYLERLSGLDWVASLFGQMEIERSANHLFVILLDFQKIGKSRRWVMEKLRDRDVGTQVHYIPIHHQPYHTDNASSGHDFSGAEAYYQRCLSLPLHPGMSVGDVDHVVFALRQIFEKTNL